VKPAILALVCAAAVSGDVAGLAWIAGCWSGGSGGLVFEEQWNKPAGGKMMGMARTLKQGRVVFSEFVRIEEKDGAVVYLPRIGESAARVAFTLTRQSAAEAVFENPAHDFPQRIVYRKDGDGLRARIEGVEKGKQRAEDFPMKAVACR
jgi:hypothetical protein